MLVLLFHATGGLIYPGGFLGVDLFFVISGFLITDMFLRMDSPTGWPRAAQLLAHRCHTLLPLSTLVLLLTAITTVLLYPSSRWTDHGVRIITSAVFVLNWQFVSQPPDLLPDLMATTDILPYPLLHYWVLSVDMQFLLLWAVIFTVVTYFARPQSTRTRGRSRFRIHPNLVQRNTAWAAIIVTLASLTWTVVSGFSEVASTQEQAFFNTSTRLWEFGLGAVIATFRTRLSQIPRIAVQLASGGGLLGILIASFCYDPAQFHPGYTALLPVDAAAAMIIGMLSHPDTGINMMFNNDIVQWLGRLTFPLYLWHWPILVIGGYLLDMPALGKGLILALLSLIAAWLSYRLVANPVAKWSPIRYSTTNTLSMGLLLSLVCFLFGILLLNIARF